MSTSCHIRQEAPKLFTDEDSEPVQSHADKPENSSPFTRIRGPDGISDDCGSFQPFQRAEPRSFSGLSLIGLASDLARSGEEIFDCQEQPSIETMTEDDKQRKIAEIMARPSRKTFFGSDTRLGHIRQRQGMDIHDERDGAWKPKKKTASRNTGSTEEDRSLQEIFGLPKEVIPVNDGQTELAFRDATRTNGKLSRSRKLYRVGKLFGGELTTRSS